MLASSLRRLVTSIAGLLAGTTLAAAPAAAQLRPLEPLDWSLYRQAHSVGVDLGVGVHHGQRASLAGIDGRLIELGTFQLAWRTGRVMLVASGTVQRLFHRRAEFAPPAPTVTATEERRHDSGDLRVVTVVRLTPASKPALLALRFGTRLPTTDNRVGLDRDQTDFFALAAGHLRHGTVSLGAEAGVGIHGTRDPGYEQSDVLLYALSAELGDGVLVPRIVLLGQKDGGREPVVRGNEDLSELRAGVHYRRGIRLEALGVLGLAEFSPTFGVLLSAGITR